MKRRLSNIYMFAGIFCIFYYLLIGVMARFGLDMSWMWLAVGGVLIAAGILCRWNRLPGWMRILWRGMLCAGLALVIGLECFVISGMNAVPPQGLDYLMILGARVEADGSPSKSLNRRIHAAADYLSANPGTIAIATGGRGEDEPIAEAECIRNGLIARGVDGDRILMEARSTSTAENMEYSGLLMEVSADTTVGIATNNYHVARAVKLAEKIGVCEAGNIYGLATEFKDVTLLHYLMRDGACALADWLLGNL